METLSEEQIDKKISEYKGQPNWFDPKEKLPDDSKAFDAFEVVTKVRIKLGLEPGAAFYNKEVLFEGQLVYEKGFYTVCLGFSEKIPMDKVILWRPIH